MIFQNFSCFKTNSSSTNDERVVARLQVKSCSGINSNVLIHESKKRTEYQKANHFPCVFHAVLFTSEALGVPVTMLYGWSGGKATFI